MCATRNSFSRTTQGLEDVSKYPDLFAELILRGWSDDALELLAGGNLLRALEQAGKVTISRSYQMFIAQMILH